MNESQELLTSIFNTVQTGQAEIRSALDQTMRPGLRKALEEKLEEYVSIEREALRIAGSRGWEMRELEPAAKAMVKLMARVRLSHGNTDSKLAAWMITGSTKGMITGLRELHQFNRKDPSIQTLSQKLLDCQTANIRQMQGFL